MTLENSRVEMGGGRAFSELLLCVRRAIPIVLAYDIEDNLKVSRINNTEIMKYIACISAS
jgi:hypothetical protein